MQVLCPMLTIVGGPMNIIEYLIKLGTVELRVQNGRCLIGIGMGLS